MPFCEKGPDYEMRNGGTITAGWEAVKKGRASRDKRGSESTVNLFRICDTIASLDEGRNS